jgi:hypothetical protein
MTPARIDTEARLAIQATLHQYARGVDRDDWELLKACYWPDATDEHGRYNGDIDGLIEWLKVEMTRYESSMHVISNTFMVIDRSEAVVESYCVAYHRTMPEADGSQVDRVLGLRYVDRFRSEHDEWRIAHRRCIYEWARIDTVSPASGLAESYVRGRRGPEDPSYQVFPA